MIRRLIPLIVALIPLVSINAASARFDVRVDKTAYLQWLESPSQPMSRPSAGGPKELLLTPGAHSAQLHLGVMCNSLGGYSIHLQAYGARSPTQLEVSGTQGIARLNLQLFSEPGTTQGGTQVSTHLDITGGSSSADVSYLTPEALPLQSYAPNVFTLKATLDYDQGAALEYYSTYVTATISLN